MKEGNKVRVVDEEGVFIIKEIRGTCIVLADEFGFEHTYPEKQVIPYISSDNFNIDFNKQTAKKEDRKIVSKAKPQNSKQEIREVDLHIGHLVDSLKNMQPHQMLQKQLNIARQEIEKARKDNVKKLILIHGKGKGVLKGEIYRLLESVPRIEFLEADIVKYRFGAVEIRFK